MNKLAVGNTVPSRYIVDLETWSTLKHSLGKKIVDLERWSTLRDSRTKTTKVEKDRSTMFREATVFPIHPENLLLTKPSKSFAVLVYSPTHDKTDIFEN